MLLPPPPWFEAEAEEEAPEERLKREFWGLCGDGVVVKVRWVGIRGVWFVVIELVFLLHVEKRAMPPLVYTDLREAAWCSSREDDLEAASIAKGNQESLSPCGVFWRGKPVSLSTMRIKSSESSFWGRKSYDDCPG